ncbi:hypothetical protein [Janibacter sp. HTCC2649]|uniref:hypothetical protein n=1 Tax=Janibacter sp. HTCC2649 TaxID=313589 RepID=UPI0005942149|nr:hypothetical protein [Janibacter sp. HTCC2649]
MPPARAGGILTSVVAEPLLRSLSRGVERGSDHRPGVTRIARGLHGVGQFFLGRLDRQARGDG